MGKQEKAIVRGNCILLCVIVILVVTMIFIWNSIVVTEPIKEEAVTAMVVSEPHTVTTPTSSDVVTPSALISATSSSSISTFDRDKKKKQERKKRIREQRRKKRLQQKKAERKRRLLEQKKKAQQRELTKAKNYSYTHQELLTLAKIIWAEARGESYKGKVSVGAVAMNRLNTKSSEFGAENGNLMEVLLKKWAFADISDLSDEEFENSEYYEECIKAAKEAFAGEDPTKEYFQNGALFFYDIYMDISEKQKRYREGIDTYKIGCHAFHVELND